VVFAMLVEPFCHLEVFMETKNGAVIRSWLVVVVGQRKC